MLSALFLFCAGCRFDAYDPPVVAGRDASVLVGALDSDKPIRIGKSTRAEVCSVLGDPDRATADRRILTYEWAIRSGRWVSAATTHERRDVCTLVLRFDHAGVLASAELLRANAGMGLATARTPLPQEIIDEIYWPPKGKRRD